MLDKIKRTRKEIDDVLNKAFETEDNSKFWGMSYEEGLIAMYDWLIEDDPEDAPMDD